MDIDPHLWPKLVTWWQSVKSQATCAILAAVMACLRGESQGGRGIAVVLDAMMCAMLAWFIRDGLEWAGANGDLSYLVSVVIGILGMKFLSGQLRQRVSFRPEERNEHQ